ncbi:ribonuclease H-like domain-containing protein [Tanacetum coccineum]
MISVATKSGQVPVNAAKQSSPRAATSISTARPVNTAAPKPKVNDALPTTYSYFKAHSPVRRAFNQKSAAKTNNFNEKVNTARVNNVTTAGPKAVVSAAVGNGENAGNPQYTLQDQGIFDSGCSRHMTGNKSFLTDYQEIDGGFVAFGGSPKGGKITGKGKIRTSKLDFEDVYFVKELKFKLLDESQVLLKVPRHDNMYSFDLKNIVLSGDENGVETKVPPKTAQALLQRQRERKAKSILLLAIPDEYQLRFHGIKDAKTLWAAIKSRFGGNVESKKMQKNVLKQQFENFSVSDTEGLDKAYDRFQKLISLLEVHGAAVSNEDANQKFLRALPSSWNNVALIMRNKTGIDDLDIDDLYNNLKVFEADIKSFDKTKVECFNCHRRGHFARECRAPRNQGNMNGDAGYRSRDNTRRTVPVETSDALVVQDNALIMQDGLGYDWRSDTELGLESVEAQLVVHQKNEAVYEEKIAVLEFEVKDKGNAVTRLTNQLEQTLKEKEDLKAKLEQFETSSKNLNKLINSQISSKDKTGLGYGDQLNENDSSGSELFNSVFDSRSSDGDDNQTNDRFKKDNGYHVVPPPLTGNYMPPLADLSFAGLDDSVYRPTTNKTSASVSQVETSITPPSNTSVEMPRVESVRPSGVIIEDWVSDDDEDIFQSNDVQTTVKPSFKKIEFTKARNEPVKSDKQAVKPRMVTQSPKVDRKDWNGKMTQKLGLGFGSTKKACFVCGSYSHLIKDCDFHEKRMAKKSVLQSMGKNTGHREVRPIWNNTQRINHQNKFVPTAVLTRSGRIPVSTAKQPQQGNPQQALKYKGMYDILDAQGIRQGNKSLTYWSIMILMEVLLPLVKVLGCKIKVTDDFSRFSWVFFLATKSETSGILKKFITEVENQLNHKVKVIRSDNGTKFKNREMDEFCGQKGIKREYSVARTPQQNRVAERKNRTLIEAARTMLADSLLPTVFWAEAVNTACYVLNRVLVTKPHNKTPYELIIGRAPSIRNQTNKNAGPQETNGNTGLKKNVDVGQTEEENVSTQQYIMFPLWSSISSNYKSSDDKAEDDTVDDDACKKTVQEPTSEYDQALKNVLDKMIDQEKEATKQSDAVRKEFKSQCDIQLLQEKITRASSWTTISFLFGGSLPIDVANLAMISLMPELEDTAEIQSTGIFGNAYDDHDLETLNTVLCRSKVTIVGTVTWIHNNHYAFRMSNVYYCCGEIRTYISEVLENAEALPKNAKYFEGFSSILQFMAFEDHEED